jgi:phosphoglycerate dehydrogenase-like enzyme
MPQHESPAVFIVSDNAEVYRKHLVHALGSDLPVRLATSAGEARDAYHGEPVILGRPDFLVGLLKTRPPVQWLQSTWAGVTPLIKLAFRDYRLTGVKGVFGPAMAEYVLAYLLAHEIRLAQRRHAQQQRRWDATLSGTLQGKVLGILGTGSIGCHVATVAQQFAMEPIGLNTKGNSVAPFRQVYASAQLMEFLSRCDYVVGILPDVPATTGLLDARAFAAMQETAYLVNVGRGNLVDDQALCQALINGRIAGAVLDVFREEPLPEDSPLWDAPDLLITGHIAAVSRPADIARLFVENYRRFCSGRELLHLVDFAKGY